MTSIVDSEAHFLKRASEIHVDQPALDVSEAERDRRMTHLRNTLVGLSIEGPLEPGRKLLDECAHQEATGQLKYMPPEKCVSRMHEVTLAKNPHKQISLDQNRLVVQDETDELTVPAPSALQAMEALKRRGIAYVFAQAVSWSEYDRYVTRLFARLHREAPAGFSRVSVAQIVEADRRVFAKLIERDVKPRRSGDGSYPLDSALDEALTSYEVSFSLMHQPLKGPGGPPKCKPDTCPRKHVCAKCFGSHPIKDHRE